MKFQPSHRDRAEQLLHSAEHRLHEAIELNRENGMAAFTDLATASATVATTHAVLAHLDALELPAPGVGDEILAAARKLTDELGPAPDFHARAFAEAVADHDHGGLTSGRDDHAQAVVPGADVARVATNAPSSVSPDAGNGSGDLRADLAEGIASTLIVDVRVTDRDSPIQVIADLAADAVIAAGWRPPPPDGEQGPAPCPCSECKQARLIAAPSADFRRGMMVALERAALDLSEAGWTEMSMWLQRCEILVHTPGPMAAWEKPPPLEQPAPQPDGDTSRAVDVFGVGGGFLYAGHLQPRQGGGWNVFHHTDSRHERPEQTVPEQMHAEDCTGCDAPGVVPCDADEVRDGLAYRDGMPIKDLGEARRG